MTNNVYAENPMESNNSKKITPRTNEGVQQGHRVKINIQNSILFRSHEHTDTKVL